MLELIANGDSGFISRTKINAGLEEQNRPKGLFRSISRVTQPIAMVDTILATEVVKENTDITMPAPGEYLFGRAGIFSVFISIDISSSGNSTTELWFEGFNGSVWAPAEDSGKIKEVSNNNQGNVIFKTNLLIPAGARFRIVAKAASGTPSAEAVILSNGVQVPSVIVAIHEA